MQDEFYTLHEIAKLLKVSYMTVFRWVRAGKLEAYKIEKQYRINRESLEKFVLERKK